MAINRFMQAALKAISYRDIDLRQNYKFDRVLHSLTHPSFKPLYKAWDEVLDADGYPLTIRSFEPKHRYSDEIILFFHGGGWITGSIGSYTGTCAALAGHTGRRVLALDYRLAPEFRFPCAVQDCYQAAKRLFLKHLPLDTQSRNIILMGDSAGGNLAAVVSLMAAERGEFRVGRQILLYPLTYNDHSEMSPFPSVHENGRDYLLTAKRLCDYTSLYIRGPQDLKSPYFAPLLAEHLEGQPRTLVITAEFDPLRDEGEAYGEKLREAGADVQIYRIRDALHGFFSLPPRFAQVKRCYQYLTAFLNGEDVHAAERLE